MLTKEEIREALVERHSEEVQSKLDEAKVAIAGLGGLGSNIAFFLTRIGVGHLHLIDFDRVDITNLNRQQYRMEHIGRYKTEALLEELREINPYLEVETDCVRVTDENVGTLFHNEDIICEAFDCPEAKAMLVSGVGEYYPDKILELLSMNFLLLYLQKIYLLLPNTPQNCMEYREYLKNYIQKELNLNYLNLYSQH